MRNHVIFKDIGSVGLQFVVQYAIVDFNLKLGLLPAALKSRKNMFFFGAARAAEYRSRTTLTHSFILHEGRGRRPTQDVSDPICKKMKFYEFLSLALPRRPPAF